MPGRVIDPKHYGRLDLDVYTALDLAARLGCKKDTITNAARKGDLRAIDLGGSGGLRIYHEAVIEWLSKGGFTGRKPRKTDQAAEATPPPAPPKNPWDE